MNEVLNSKRSMLKKFLWSLVVFVAMMGYGYYKGEGMGVAVEISIFIALIYNAYWAIYLCRDPAWVLGNKLKIKTWLFWISEIDIGKVQEAEYRTGNDRYSGKRKSELHHLILTMDDNSKWTISISDYHDHIEDMRLYNFLARQFPDLKLSHKTI